MRHWGLFPVMSTVIIFLKIDNKTLGRIHNVLDVNLTTNFWICQKYLFLLKAAAKSLLL